MAPALARAGYGELAGRCHSLRTPTELIDIARSLRSAPACVLQHSLISAFEHAADAGRQWLAGLPTGVVFCTFSAMREIASLEGERFADKVYRRAAGILEAALAIGNQAEPSSREAVAGRLEVAKGAPEAAYGDGPLIAA